MDDLAGLGRSQPVLSFALVAFLFSLTGLPPTLGFWGKLNLFFAAWDTRLAHYRLLAVLMAINAAFGAWYYLRLVGVVYLRQGVRPLAPTARQRPAVVAIALCAAVTVGGFFLPNALWQAAGDATRPAAAAPVVPVSPERP